MLFWGPFTLLFVQIEGPHRRSNQDYSRLLQLRHYIRLDPSARHVRLFFICSWEGSCFRTRFSANFVPPLLDICIEVTKKRIDAFVQGQVCTDSYTIQSLEESLGYSENWIVLLHCRSLCLPRNQEKSAAARDIGSAHLCLFQWPEQTTKWDYLHCDSVLRPPGHCWSHFRRSSSHDKHPECDVANFTCFFACLGPLQYSSNQWERNQCWSVHHSDLALFASRYAVQAIWPSDSSDVHDSNTGWFVLFFNNVHLIQSRLHKPWQNGASDSAVEVRSIHGRPLFHLFAALLFHPTLLGWDFHLNFDEDTWTGGRFTFLIALFGGVVQKQPNKTSLDYGCHGRERQVLYG